MRAACGAATLALALGSACADDPAPAPPLGVDAGPDCQLGTRNCECVGGTRCGQGLVCLVGRCSLGAGEPDRDPEPPRRPRPPSPVLPEPDAGATPPTDADTPDASSPEGEPPDASAPGADATAAVGAGD